MKSHHADAGALQRAKLTYRLTLAKSPFMGVLETGFVSLSLLIAIRIFDAGDYTKASIAMAGGLGMLFTPVSLYLSSLTRLRTTTLMAGYQFISGLLLMASIWAPQLMLYALLLILAQAAHSQSAPLMIQIFTRNYPPAERGRRVSQMVAIGSAVGALFSLFAGRLLDISLDNYTVLLGCMSLGCMVNTMLTLRIPGESLPQGSSGNPWQNISLIWQDRLFGAMLGGWMLMGMAMLITVPLRVEYIANPIYGINATNEQVALITVFIPSILRIFSSQVWGRLFDRIHFITLRCLITFFLGCGVILYFNATSLIWLGIGTALIGIGFGGGNIAWQLWVTKISPPHKVSAYMSVHAATTGLRGIIAPFLGYYIIQHGSPSMVGWVSGVMVLFSILLFSGLREAMNDRARDTL